MIPFHYPATRFGPDATPAMCFPLAVLWLSERSGHLPALRSRRIFIGPVIA